MPKLLIPCLLASGASSLIFELLWSRIFSFSFGSTSLAFAAVLAVFFLGLAGGSHLGGHWVVRMKNPMRFYSLLEASIGLYSALLFPLLFQLDKAYTLINVSGATPVGFFYRFCVAAALLAIPTLAMGATFPALVEYARQNSNNLKATLGWLYGINTLGAFLGVYLATHWLLPNLGLSGSYAVAVLLNGLAVTLSLAIRTKPKKYETNASSAPVAQERADEKKWTWVAFILVGVTGFTTLGYEIAWSRVLTIAMEGSLYGIGATLGAFLAGIGLGGLLWSWTQHRFDSHKKIITAYVVVCLGMTSYLAMSPLLLSVQGYWLKVLTAYHRDILGLHLNFSLAILFLLPITGGLGFLFPAALTLLRQEHGSRRISSAYALNTAMSVAGSLVSAMFLMDKLGIEGMVWVFVLIQLTALAAVILITNDEIRSRWKLLAPILIALFFTAGFWPSIDAKPVLLANFGQNFSLSQLFQNLSTTFQKQPSIRLYKDGVGSTVSVTLLNRTYGVSSNGLPQSGRKLDPPHHNLESILVGLFPALHYPEAKQALVIGLGAGISVKTLHAVGIPQVDVIELEPTMPMVCKFIYPPGESPLDDSGVNLHIDDARNFLLRNRHAPAPRRWGIIASQPAHPWVSGAADLFTREMFLLAHSALEEGGVFGQWFMPSGINDDAMHSIVNAFGSVFEQMAIYRLAGQIDGFFLVGVKGHRPLQLAPIEKLLARPSFKQFTGGLPLNEPADVFQFTLVSLVSSASVMRHGPTNSDRNLFIESRMPLIDKSRQPSLAFLPDSLPLGLQTNSFTRSESLLVFQSIDRLLATEIADAAQKARPLNDTLSLTRSSLWAERSISPWREYAKWSLATALAQTTTLSGSLKPYDQNLSDSLANAIRGTRGMLQSGLIRLYLRSFPQHWGRLAHLEIDSLDIPENLKYEIAKSHLLSVAEYGNPSQMRLALNEYPGFSRTDSTLAILVHRHMPEPHHGHSEASPFPIAIDTLIFDTAYTECLRQYPNRASYLKALLTYCQSSPQTRRREAQRIEVLQGRLLALKQQQTQIAIAEAGQFYKQSLWIQAANSFQVALNHSPLHLQALAGLAEVWGRLDRKEEYGQMQIAFNRANPEDLNGQQILTQAFMAGQKAGKKPTSTGLTKPEAIRIQDL